jgi:hypothetical protein
MKEIEALYRQEGYCKKIYYKRIRTDDIDVNTLKAVLRLSNCKDANFVDLPDFYAYGYSDKPTVYISKESGRILAEENNNKSRLQAIVLLEILESHDLVEGFCRKQHRRHQGEELQIS